MYIKVQYTKITSKYKQFDGFNKTHLQIMSIVSYQISFFVSASTQLPMQVHRQIPTAEPVIHQLCNVNQPRAFDDATV